jgi:predicted MFS family arabinose efflux permease
MFPTSKNARFTTRGDYREQSFHGEFRRGWALLLAATLGSMASLSSIAFYSLGLFIAPLQTEFGWSRSDVTSSFFYTTVTLALISPLLGGLIDRLGPKRLALVSIPAMAGVFFLLSRFHGSLIAFHALYAVTAVAGAGTTPINYTRAVNGAFDERRGLALGITQAGIALAAITLPLLLTRAISAHGWRAGFSWLAILALIPWPFVFVGIREQQTSTPQAGHAVEGLSTKEAMRTGVFWLFALSFAAIAAAVSALVVHLVPLLRDAGVAPLKAAQAASLIGIGVLGGRIAGGYLMDRFFAPYVAATMFVTTACGCLSLLVGGSGMATVAACLMGFALGAEADMIAYMTARYFGLARYGAIYAIVYSLFLLGAATGPTLAAISYDKTHSYTATLWGILIVLATGSVVIAKLPKFESFRSALPWHVVAEEPKEV